MGGKGKGKRKRKIVKKVYREEDVGRCGDGRELSPDELWTDELILEGADLAIKDYEAKTGQKLKLEGLVSGEYALVQGDLFRLNLKVTDENGKACLYETEVYSCFWDEVLEITGKLTPFILIPETQAV